MRLVGVKELRSAAIGPNFIDDAGIAGRYEQVSRVVEGHGPDVLALRIEEKLRFTALVDTVNLRVGQDCRVDPVFGIHGERVYFQAG
jgi:hypothetical protein